MKKLFVPALLVLGPCFLSAQSLSDTALYAALKKVHTENRNLTSSEVASIKGYVKQKGSPLIAYSKDSASISFIYEDAPEVKSVRLVSDLVPYFDNGINYKPDNVGWFKKDTSGIWSLSVTVDDRLKIPYKFAVTFAGAGKDSLVEILDPYNKNVFSAQNKNLAQSLIELKNSFPYTWNQGSTDPKWEKLTVASANASMRNDMYVYTPPGFDANAKNKYRLLIGLGSFTYGVEIPTAKIYETLLKENNVKPAVIVLTDYKSYNSKSDLDSASIFITRDVLPFLRKNYNVSEKASDVVISGISRRGMAASYIAFSNEKYIGNVISLSGAFYWKPQGFNEYEWLASQMAATAPKKITYYLSSGNLESIVTNTNAGHYMLSANRHMRNVLLARNYKFLYEELPGAHNTVSWQHGLYNGMKYVLK